MGRGVVAPRSQAAPAPAPACAEQEQDRHVDWRGRGFFLPHGLHAAHFCGLRGSAPPWSPAGPDGWNAADQRLEGEAVVHGRAGHGDGERGGLGVGQHVRLAALLAAIDRVRLGRLFPHVARTGPRRRSARSQSISPGPRVRPAPLGAADATGQSRPIPNGGDSRWRAACRSPISPPSGCRFRTRCGKDQDRCAAQEPPLFQLSGKEEGHLKACHFPEDPTTEARASTSCWTRRRRRWRKRARRGGRGPVSPRYLGGEDGEPNPRQGRSALPREVVSGRRH